MLFFFIFRKKLICVNIFFSTASTQLSHVSYRKPSCLSETHIGIISKMSSNFVSVEKMAKISENQSKIVVRLLSSSPTTDDASIMFNKLPDDIIEQIVSNYKSLLPSKYVLRKWVKKDELDWSMLSVNPCAIKIMEKNKDLVNWKYITRNPNATELLKERVEYESTLTSMQYNNLGTNNRIDWRELSRCECIFEIV